jgi:hypothetical protein
VIEGTEQRQSVKVASAFSSPSHTQTWVVWNDNQQEQVITPQPSISTYSSQSTPSFMGLLDRTIG